MNLDYIDEFKRREMAKPDGKLGAVYRVQEAIGKGASKDELSAGDLEFLAKYEGIK